MENEKPYTKRENRYFQINCGIKNCFPLTYSNCLKTYCESTRKKYKRTFYGETLRLR